MKYSLKSCHSWILPGGLVMAALVLGGCRPDPQPRVPWDDTLPPQASRPSVALRVLVVNDRPLAESIARLGGEWAERSGGTFRAEAVAWPDLSAADSIEADVVIFPSRYLGEMCERQWLRPVRSAVLESEDYQAPDVFPLVRRRLTSYGNQVMAVPLGIDLPVMCYRADFFGQVDLPAPETWDEYARRIDAYRSLFADRDTTGLLLATWEPVRTWGAVLLLSRAAPYVVHPDSLGALFDPETMRPRIADPPLVRALEELHDASAAMLRVVPSDLAHQIDQLEDPRAASWHVASERALIAAIGLPPAGHRDVVLPDAETSPAQSPREFHWAPLPGGREVFNPASANWEPLDRVHRVPLVGAGDRLSAVTTSSRNAASAFQLLAWLASPEVSSQFARAGKGTMPVRRSLASSPLWFDPRLSPAERAELGDALTASLGGQHYLLVPRIPGVDDYLAALDQGVQDVVFHGHEPAAALQQVADAWEEITVQHGRQQQRQAYLRHLGIEN